MFGQFTRLDTVASLPSVTLVLSGEFLLIYPKIFGVGTGYVPELCTKSSDLISTTGRNMKHLLFKSSKCHFKADQDKVQGQFGQYCQKDNACENK